MRKFDRDSIVEFKRKGRRYISWHKNIKPFKLRQLFYNSLKEYGIDDKAGVSRKLTYCKSKLDFGDGIYSLGLRYAIGKKTYYLFWSTNSYWASPMDISVGKLVNGNIYLVREEFSNKHQDMIHFLSIPQGFVDKTFIEGQFYQNTIFTKSKDFSKEQISEKDIEILKNAYEGMQEFSSLIHEISM